MAAETDSGPEAKAAATPPEAKAAAIPPATKAAATPPATAAAFFDLDRTLMEGSSAFQFGRAAFKAGMMNRRQLLSDGWANLRFRLQGSTDTGTHELRDRISASLKGTRVRDLQRLGPEVLARVLPRIYPQMLSVAYEHQDAGRRVYIFTAASQELAEMLAHVLTFDGGVGSQFSAVEGGVFTGQPTGLFIYGADKARAIKRLADQEGIDLSESYAYSDSSSDLPMLRAVGHPVAVNPDKELLAEARENGWQVLRFDRLGRRLKAAVGVAGAAALGGATSAALAARARRRSSAVALRPVGRGSRKRVALRVMS
jgi:HAD superfamily hydrolase (TIGR01490 family)